MNDSLESYLYLEMAGSKIVHCPAILLPLVPYLAVKALGDQEFSIHAFPRSKFESMDNFIEYLKQQLQHPDHRRYRQWQETKTVNFEEKLSLKLAEFLELFASDWGYLCIGNEKISAKDIGKLNICLYKAYYDKDKED